jgi:hypothetical protein
MASQPCQRALSESTFLRDGRYGNIINGFAEDPLIKRSIIAHSLNWYKFIGRILGKALYEGILVDVAFAPFFLAKVTSFHSD